MEFGLWLERRKKRDACYHKVKARYRVWPSAYASGALVRCRKVGAANWGNSTDESFTNSFRAFDEFLTENKFKLEKEQGLHGWFARNKGKGWVDCRASKKGHIVPCGRQQTGKGAERKYPACRPTLSACTTKGVKRKKSSKQVSWD
jgi:hypothetical protein